MNSNSDKIYPLTLKAIESYGIEKWLKDFSMPVHAEEYQRIYSRLFSAYTENLPKEKDNPTLYWVCAACYKITMSLSSFYFRRMLYMEMEKQGITVSGEVSDSEMPGKGLSLDFYAVENPDFYLRLKEHWRKIRTNWGYRGVFESFLPGDLTGSSLYIVGDRSHSVVANYVKNKGVTPICLRPNLYIKDKYRVVSQEIEDDIRDFVRRWFDDFNKDYPDSALIFDHALVGQCCDYLIERTRDYNSINTFLSNKKCTSELLINPLANLSLRLFAAAWRSHGGDVTGFTHGNSYTECNPSDVLNGSHSILSKYISSSEGDQKIQDFARNSVSHALVSREKFATCKNPAYRQVFEKLQDNKIVKKGEIQKVMLSGFPMDYSQYFGWPSLNTLTYCHFEISIIKALRDAGKYVIYKAHPDTLSETREIMEQYADEFLTENFSEVYSQADCLLFTYPSTTPFGFSLMTDMPMVVFCENIDKWYPDLLVELKKRCVILPMSMDQGSRVKFDSKELLDAIEQAPKYSDHSVIKEYALK